MNDKNMYYDIALIIARAEMYRDYNTDEAAGDLIYKILTHIVNICSHKIVNPFEEKFFHILVVKH